MYFGVCIAHAYNIGHPCPVFRFPVDAIVFKPTVELRVKPSAITTSSGLLALSTVENTVLDLHTHIL